MIWFALLLAFSLGLVIGWKIAIYGVCKALDAGRLDELLRHVRRGHLS